jgi:hypothetical protein
MAQLHSMALRTVAPVLPMVAKPVATTTTTTTTSAPVPRSAEVV